MTEGYLTRTGLRDELRQHVTKDDLAKLEVKISASKSRLIKWMFALMAGSAAVASAVAFIFQRTLG